MSGVSVPLHSMEGAGGSSDSVGAPSPPHSHRARTPTENSTKFFKNNFFSGRVVDLLNQRKPKKHDHEKGLVEENTEVDIYYFSHERLERKSTSNVDEVTSVPPEWAQVVWINIDGINEKLLRKLSLDFNLHPLAVEDVVEIAHRPKVDLFGDTLFLITSIISKISRGGRSMLETEQVSFFLIGKTLITIQQGLPGDVWESVRTSIVDQDSIIRQSDSGFLLYALLSGIVDTCKPILDELDDGLEDLEVAMMDKPSHNLNKMVYAVKRHQITLRSILMPTRKILQKLMPDEAAAAAGDDNTSSSSGMNTMRSTPARGINHSANIKKDSGHILSSVTQTYFRDLLGVLTHLCDQLDSQKEVVASLSSLYSDHQAQRQGTASYAIAIVSVFFLPLTFVAGVYGMNFSYMPELLWHLGYLYVWMIFLGIVLAEVIIFWAVGWLEFRVSRRIANWFGKKDNHRRLPRKLSMGNSLIALETDSVEM